MANDRYPRSLRGVIERDRNLYPVVAVMGARQVGKSTLCREISNAHGLNYATLDDRDVLTYALNDPEGFLDDLGDDGAFIDEAQRAPDLFVAIKAIVDREQQVGRYLLSGSSQPKVSAAVAESLLGRAAYRTLHPLTLSELRFDDVHPGWEFIFGTDETLILKELKRRAEASGAPDWKDVVTTGGFPRAVTAAPEDRAQILEQYVRVFASQDIREIIGVDSTDRFERFVRLVGVRTGQELNASGMSRDLGTPVNTIRRWLDALHRSYLIDLIEPYSRNAGQRVIKSPKLFAVDSAFALAAAREIEPTGFHLENIVANDLNVWRGNGSGRGLYHWRLQAGQEVDFVLEMAGQLLPVEVKCSTSIGMAEARHLRTFMEKHANSPRAILISCDPDVRALAPGVLASPWWGIL